LYEGGAVAVPLPEEVAAWILAETVRRKASLRDVASEYFSKKPSLEYMKPLVRVLTLGVARNYLLLDRVLATGGYGPPNHSTRWMLARAAVFEALSGRLKPSRARALAEKTGLDADWLLSLRGARPVEFVKGLGGLDRLSVLYSFPRWLLEELAEAKIPRLEELLRALNRDPVRWLRFPYHRVSFEELAARLQKQGVKLRKDLDLPDVAEVVEGASRVVRTEEYRRGLVVLQDKASALVSWVAGPEGKVVHDPTAGAAIKASHSLWLGARYAVAGDLKPPRLREAIRTLDRLGLRHAADLVVGDARAPYVRGADVVIVDPPCSDVGRLQYEPEVKLWLTRGDVKFFRRVQARMLVSQLEAAPPGSTVVYSV
jgi:16S rRNA (cytosine967-C5)-methyltransferase